ncbi:MAG: PPC domain-containing protein [Chloroflexota bacterium]
MKRIAFVLLWLAALMAVAVSAQGSIPGLSVPDALLLLAANTADMNSFAFEYTFHLESDLDTLSGGADLSGAGVADREAPALAATLSGEIRAGSTQVIPVDAELRWVEDRLYYHTEAGWQAHEGASAYAADFLAHYLSVYADPATLATWDASGIDGVNEIFTALASSDLALFLSAQRLDDETVGDEETAHFQTSADLHALMQTDAFVDAVANVAVVQGTRYQIYDHAALATMIDSFSGMFEGATLNLDQYIGASDGLLHRVTLALNMPVDPARDGYPDAPFTITAILDVTLSDLNQPQSVSAPEGAETVSEFTFPAPPPLEAPQAGSTQYGFMEWMDENATSTHSFEAEAGDVVTITVRKLGFDFDPHVALIAPDGATLAENEDYETAGILLRDYDSQIAQFAIPQSGSYSVAVGEYDGLAGSFLLTINVER